MRCGVVDAVCIGRAIVVCGCSCQVSRMGWVYGGMRIVCLVGRLAVQYVVFKAVMFGVWAGCLGDEQVQRGVSIWADRC